MLQNVPNDAPNAAHSIAQIDPAGETHPGQDAADTLNPSWILRQRGIDAAALAAGWECYPFTPKGATEQILGWRYPIFDLTNGEVYIDPATGKPVYRWKNVDKQRQGGLKYAWLGQQGQCPSWYVLPGTHEAIAREAGRVYIANGEPAVLAYRAAGIDNALCWLNGETSVPKNLVEMLTALGVREVIYLFDKDDTGTRSAQKVADQLLETPIAFIAVTLPDNLADKADSNDYWMACAFDAEFFRARLAADVAERRFIDQLAHTRRPHNAPQTGQHEDKRGVKSGAQTTTPVDWVAEKHRWQQEVVLPALDRAAPVVKRGGYRHCPSPTHQDANPSFRISTNKYPDGYPVCSCGIQDEADAWGLIAEYVGAPSFMDWWRDQQAQSQRTLRPQPPSHAKAPPDVVKPANEPILSNGHGVGGSEPPDKTGSDYREFDEPEIPPFTDVGNAERFVRQHGHDVRYVPLWDQWLIWDDTYWRPDELGQIVNLAIKTVESIVDEVHLVNYDLDRQKAILRHAQVSQSKGKLHAMIDLAKSFEPIPVLPEQLDANPWLLGCANGTVDLRTGALRPAQRSDLITKQARTEYKPELLDCLNDEGLAAVAPVFARFLNDVTGGSLAYQTYLQRIVGYTLTGDVSEEVFFVLYGGGRNGKSKLLELLAALLGDYTTKAQYESFVRQSHESVRSHTSDIARLAEARLVYANEGNAGRLLNVALVNELTGGDSMSASRKYENEFEFHPQLKLWLATNHMPGIPETSLGIWRRIHVLPFTQTIPLDKLDKHILDKMKRELAGVLAWAVQGCLDWQRDGLAVPLEVERATARFRTDEDTVAQFIEAHCVTEIAPKPTYGSDLLNAYVRFCADMGLSEQMVKQRAFYKRLEEWVGVKRIQFNNQAAFTGIQLKTATV